MEAEGRISVGFCAQLLIARVFSGQAQVMSAFVLQTRSYVTAVSVALSLS